MIDYKIRQEKQGVYLLDRRRGTAQRLPQPAFELVRALSTFGYLPPDWPAAGLALYFGTDIEEGQHWWSTFEALGLTTERGLRTLQIIPLLDNLVAVPDDCLAAPARVYFELTRRCNLACQTCFNNSHRPLADELTTSEIYAVLDELDRLGTFEIRLTGGEPTEHPDFREIIAYARARGFYISLGTNGVYDDRKRSWIYEAGVDWFIVSLDGTADINDRVRGSGTYHQVRQTLSELAQQAKQRVRLNMVVGRHNVQCIEDLARLADQYHIESLNLIPLRP